MAEYRSLVEIPHARSETARRYRFDDGVGEIGIIAPVSHPFCGHCSRIRITSDGKIRTCLLLGRGITICTARCAAAPRMTSWRNSFSSVIQKKEERHHIGEPDFVPASRTMVHIGGRHSLSVVGFQSSVVRKNSGRARLQTRRTSAI